MPWREIEESVDRMLGEAPQRRAGIDRDDVEEADYALHEVLDGLDFDAGMRRLTEVVAALKDQQARRMVTHAHKLLGEGQEALEDLGDYFDRLVRA